MIDNVLPTLRKTIWAELVHSVQRLATGWTIRGSNPGEGRAFSAPVQTGPGAHPTSCTTDTGSFPGAKRPWRLPPLSNAEVKERVQLFLYSPLLGLFQGDLYLYIRKTLLSPSSWQSKTNTLLQAFEYREDGRIKLLRNVSNKLQTNTASHDTKLYR